MKTVDQELHHCKLVVFDILRKDQEEIDPSDVVDILIHSVDLLEQVDVDEVLVDDLNDWIDTNIDLIDTMFAAFSLTTQPEMQRTLLSGFLQDLPNNRDLLGTFHIYYTALFGLWLAREYDPTQGEAWGYLDYVVEEIDPQNFGLIKRYISENFIARTSLSPIQALWQKIVNKGGYVMDG